MSQYISHIIFNSYLVFDGEIKHHDFDKSLLIDGGHLTLFKEELET